MKTALFLIRALVSALAVGGLHGGTPAGAPASFSDQISEWPCRRRRSVGDAR